MIGDAELRGFRADYYGLLVTLLWREPARDLVARLGQDIAHRIAAAHAVHPQLAAGWRDVARFLAETPADRLGDTLAEEYTRLFLGPFGAEVNPYESYYLSGRLLDRPLAELRGSLAQLGIVKDETYAEPEDFLACELDVLRQLIRRQAEAADPDTERRAVDAQASFLKRHLLVWGPSAARDIADAKSAVFYAGVGRLAEGFLAFERDLFQTWGDEPVLSLEVARGRFAGVGQWRGPLVDFPGPAEASPAGDADAQRGS